MAHVAINIRIEVEAMEDTDFGTLANEAAESACTQIEWIGAKVVDVDVEFEDARA